MDKAFKELIAAIELNRKMCPWQKKMTLENQTKEFLLESKEVEEAVKKKDYKNLKEELGDVLWDVLTIAHIAEDKGHFKAKEIFESINKKIKRRKHYMFEGKTVDIPTAIRIWDEVKEKEKKGEYDE
jgi:uncharacterized protein YabN with tetrapyrrole methylase and pyrophosphatase domain|tara:strand:- start:185 stop:565 length:381 start_codon:yes stop_codon:yes gene_type:complete